MIMKLFKGKQIQIFIDLFMIWCENAKKYIRILHEYVDVMFDEIP